MIYLLLRVFLLKSCDHFPLHRKRGLELVDAYGFPAAFKVDRLENTTPASNPHGIARKSHYFSPISTC